MLTGIWSVVLVVISWLSWVRASWSLCERDQDGTQFYGVAGWTFGFLATLLAWDKFQIFGSYLTALVPESENMLHTITVFIVSIIVLAVWFLWVPVSAYVYFGRTKRHEMERWY